MQDKTIEAILEFSKHFLKKGQSELSISNFSDGSLFAQILQQVDGFRLSFSQIDFKPSSWTVGLKNLKHILENIQLFFQAKLKKGIMINDINLTEISKNKSQIETQKFFQAVIAVLIQSPNKEQYFSVITTLSPSIQTTFIQLIPRICEKRVLNQKLVHEDKVLRHMAFLEEQNQHLSSQLKTAHEKIQSLDEELRSLSILMEEKEKDILQLLERFQEEPNGVQESLIKHYEDVKQKNQHLKDRLSDQSRLHEMQAVRLKDEINYLKQQLDKLEDVEELLSMYKEKYNEAMISLGGTKKLQKQKSTLRKMLGQKQFANKRLNDKVEQLMAENYSLREHQVYLQMEIQRRDVRFIELEKEIKKKLNSTKDQNTNIFSISDHVETNPLSAQLQQLSIMNIQDVKKIKRDLERTTSKFRQIEKDNFRLRRLGDRFSKLEEEKKKLEKMIYQVTEERNQQFFLLVSTLHDLTAQSHTIKEQNKKYLKLLKSNKLIQ